MNTITDRNIEVIDRYRSEIQSGLAADRISSSNRSADRMNYRHMVPARTYGEVVTILGRTAAMGDIYAEAASKALTKISPFLNDWQVQAGIADAFSQFIRTDWYDTREATGPEAGRPSSHTQPVSLRTAVILHLVLCEVSYALQLGTLPGPGWCLKAIANELSLATVVTATLPRTSAALTKES